MESRDFPSTITYQTYHCYSSGSGGNGGSPPDLKKYFKKEEFDTLINIPKFEILNDYKKMDNLLFEIICNSSSTVDYELVGEIKSYFNGSDVKISPHNIKLEGSFKLAQKQLIADIQKANDILFLSALNSDSDSLPHCLPKEIGLYILQLKYPFLVSFEQFKSGLNDPFRLTLKNLSLFEKFTPIFDEKKVLPQLVDIKEEFLSLGDIAEDASPIFEKKEDQSSCRMM